MFGAYLSYGWVTPTPSPALPVHTVPNSYQGQNIGKLPALASDSMDMGALNLTMGPKPEAIRAAI